MNMEIKPIRTKADHRAALKENEALMSARPGTPEGDRLDVLATLVEAWEKKRYPMELPDPVEAIKFRMEQSGLAAKDLVPMIGQINRVYEVLNRKRPLTLQMIRRLHRDLGIPSESVIKPTTVRRGDQGAKPISGGRSGKRSGKGAALVPNSATLGSSDGA